MAATKARGTATEAMIADNAERVLIEARHADDLEEAITNLLRKQDESIGGCASIGSEVWHNGRFQYCRDPAHCKAKETIDKNKRNDQRRIQTIPQPDPAVQSDPGTGPAGMVQTEL